MHNATAKRLIHDSPVIVLFSIASLLCCASIIYLAIPQWSMYKERMERISHYDTFISSTEGFDKMRREFELKNEALSSKLNNASSHTPSRSLSGILEELISRSKENGIVLAKIQPQPEIKPQSANSALTYIPVFLETNTDYHKLGRFTASLETLPQILQISKMAVETNKNGELNVKLLVTCLAAADKSDE
ncbi:MAG: type 4a pilus biogenesis protein PilO [Chitinispirillales bacterium]|jgi:hypothetical protein|nr:type 4a pilus biogenesis protein PilO [Chitinispirillales bacterium]